MNRDRIQREVERARQDAKLEAELERKAKENDARRTEQPEDRP